MKKGIVMQIDEGFLTLLTPEGEFLRARKQEQTYVIGQEIDFYPIGSSANRKPFLAIFQMKPVLAIAAALLIAIGSFLPMYQTNHAYAYLSIDANPSIELGINKKMQVIELTGFNQQGKQIIAQLDGWKKQDVLEIAESIIAKMKKEGFLKENKQLIISTVRTKEPEKKIDKQLEASIKEIKASVSQQELELTVVSGTEQDLKKAHELGLTTGKFQTRNNQNVQEKVKSNLKNKRENNAEIKVNPLRPAATAPPGQVNKQEQSKAEIGIGNEVPQPEANQSHSGSNPIPPGQLKKAEEPKQNKGQLKKTEELKQNNGQLKKTEEPKQNNGQLKKTEEPKQNNGQLFKRHNQKNNSHQNENSGQNQKQTQ